MSVKLWRSFVIVKLLFSVRGEKEEKSGMSVGDGWLWVSDGCHIIG